MQNENFNFQDLQANSDENKSLGRMSPSWNKSRLKSGNLGEGSNTKIYQKDEMILAKSKTNTSQYYKRRKSLISKVIID